jgi:hypothetical protein
MCCQHSTSRVRGTTCPPWALRIVAYGLAGLDDKAGPGHQPIVAPAAAWAVVNQTCERPDVGGQSRSPWDSAALARQLGHDGGRAPLSPPTVPRRLAGDRERGVDEHTRLPPRIRQAPT